ncbi:pyridoxamine kinase [Harryflintia acetispora]|uniref:pyridoxal kinase n=1 Tax=Harryflintia acetispora TaxID=1849041 RepID=A0A9X8UI96_9FIRM|nr:pyridoxamine kinase [Harryflintia acetispora]TCL42641.1 pyridoxine kinase [Harryflintia acetispora]
MENRPGRVLAIHDLSGFGRCSLTVILPILSAMGVQVCPLPTAVLSTHTGNLGDVEMRDLTDFIAPALAHYERLGIDFECVYTGFLGGAGQIDSCLRALALYPKALAVVDPVMGDHGKAYRTMNADMIRRMGELVAGADVITPNLTEACMLLHEDYRFEPLTRTQAKSMLARLCELGPKYAVITGVQMADGKIANLGFDRERGSYWMVGCDYTPVSYPGTGDMFASVLVGGFLRGDSLPIAMARATGFLERTIKNTFSYSSDPRFGVMFERDIGLLESREVSKSFSLL